MRRSEEARKRDGRDKGVQDRVRFSPSVGFTIFWKKEITVGATPAALHSYDLIDLVVKYVVFWITAS